MAKKKQIKQDRILLIDDHANFRERIKTTLENNGYKVDTLPCSRRAFDQLCLENYVAIIMDLGESSINNETYAMPELVREHFPHIKLIGQTAESSIAQIDQQAQKYFDAIYLKRNEHLLIERLARMLT